MTQTQLILSAMTWKPMTIKEVATEIDAPEPSVRRILWQWAKQWIFERIAPGIYTITIGETTKAIIKCGDSLHEIKKLKNAGYKFDMVFLDIPYDTPAIKWGNRGAKYEFISTTQFEEFLTDLKYCITDRTHVYHMYSNAPSWWKQMKAYNDCFERVWLKLQRQWWWQKLHKNWKPVAFCGKVSAREWLALYSGTDIDVATNMKFDFTSERPRTHSEKCSHMIHSLISQSTKIWDRILDPFSGTWVVWEQSLILWRSVMLFEKSIDRVKNEIIPRLTTIFSK